MEQADPLPTRLRAAASYEILRHFSEMPDVELWVTAELEDRWQRSWDPILYLGGELVAGEEDLFLIRAGYGQQAVGAEPPGPAWVWAFGMNGSSWARQTVFRLIRDWRTRARSHLLWRGLLRCGAWSLFGRRGLSPSGPESVRTRLIGQEPPADVLLRPMPGVSAGQASNLCLTPGKPLPIAGIPRPLPNWRPQRRLWSRTPEPGKAFLFSAVLPGAGQWFMDQDRWPAYLAVELWAWIQFLDSRREGQQPPG